MGIPLLTRTLSRELEPRLLGVRAELNAVLVDGLQGIADLLIFGRAASHQKQVQKLSRELAALQQRQAWLTGLHTALLGLLTNWTTLAILLIAIPLVNRGHLDGVYLALLVLVAMAGFEAVAPLPEAGQHLERSLAAARRLFELVDTQPAVSDLPPATAAPGSPGFRLDGQKCEFSVRPGRTRPR